MAARHLSLTPNSLGLIDSMVVPSGCVLVAVGWAHRDLVVQLIH